MCGRLRKQRRPTTSVPWVCLLPNTERLPVVAPAVAPRAGAWIETSGTGSSAGRHEAAPPARRPKGRETARHDLTVARIISIAAIPSSPSPSTDLSSAIFRPYSFGRLVGSVRVGIENLPALLDGVGTVVAVAGLLVWCNQADKAVNSAGSLRLVMPAGSANASSDEGRALSPRRPSGRSVAHTGPFPVLLRATCRSWSGRPG